MAVSRDTSNGPDWKDVTRALLHFEKELRASIKISLRAGGTEKSPILLMVASMLMENPVSGGPQLSASASVSMPGRGAGDIAAALHSLVYELDKDAYRQIEGIQLPA